MENGLIIAAAALCACAALFSFVYRAQPFAGVLRRCCWTVASALALAALALMLAHLLADRFDYAYVSGHSAKAQPLLYKISALWAGQEGSFLFWSTVLAVTGLPLAYGRLNPKAFCVYALVSACVLAMCAVSSPFAMLNAPPSDGSGLTVALQNPWMAAHPPLVFIAYSAMAALAAQAAAFDGKPPAGIQWWRRFCWVMLGLGIFTGSIWAYNALGWGGYWAWDPIENAALAPWLMLCGDLHCSKETRARCVLPFAAACVGTFLTRSGVLKDTSAHAYTDGDIAVTAIIGVLLLGAVIWLVAVRLHRKTNRDTPSAGLPLWHDTHRLFRFAAYACAALVLAGTLAPLATGVSTPTGFYTAVAVAFALACTGLLLLRDRDALKRRSAVMMALSAAAVVGAAFALGAGSVCLLALLWVCLSPLCLWIVSGFKSQGWRYYLRHIGLILLIAGVIFSLGFSREGLAVINPDSAHATVAGVPVSTPVGSDVIIASSPWADVILDGSRAMLLPDGSMAVPFITRPLIYLFWIGGFLTVLSPPLVRLIEKAYATAGRKAAGKAHANRHLIR